MGWTGTVNPYKTVDEFFDNEFKGGKCQFVGKGAVVNLSEYYRCMEDTETGERFVLVCKLSLKPQDGCNIFYKDMTENMYPYYFNCPAKILAEAEKTPARTEDGRRWREKVHEVLSLKARAKQVKFGSKIKFKEPLAFGNGYKEDTFLVKRYGKRGFMFVSMNYGFYARISNWRTREFEFVS